MLQQTLRTIVRPQTAFAPRTHIRTLVTSRTTLAENSPTPPANPTASTTAPERTAGKTAPNEASATDAPEERSLKSKDEEERPLRSRAEESEGKYGSGEKVDAPAEPQK